MKNWLSRIFNIAPPLWPRVSECWSITLFFKIGSAIGWTILTTAFIARFGIAMLPLLFIINAVLIILGTMFFERLIMKMKREVLMILMLLFAATFLFLASFLYTRHPYAFFALVIFAESIFLAQFNVFIPILVGDRFTPLESQRTFPVIESAESIAGMLGGVFVAVFASKIAVPIFLYAWIAFLACVIFVVLFTNISQAQLPPLPFRVKQTDVNRDQGPGQMKQVLVQIQNIPFLKGLVFIVLFQWIFMNVLEFQFTKAIEQSVTFTREETVAHIPASFFHASVLSAPGGIHNIEAARQTRMNYELTVDEQEQLASSLASVKSAAYLAALIVQALLASRLLTSLGIVGSMLIHPVIMLMSLVGMFLKFGFLSSSVAKVSFETTNVVHKNAYFSSHYALPKDIRDQAAEFLEGVVRPLGTVVGMLLLFGMQVFLSGRELSLWIHVFMFLLMIVILFSTMRLFSQYTDISREQLFSSLPYPEKLDAIEILAQKGHRHAPIILIQKLREISKEEKSAQSHAIRMKILSALGQFQDIQALPELLDALYDPDPEIRLESANALMNYRTIGEQFYAQAFSRFRLIEALKEVFPREDSASVRGAIIRLFSILKQTDTIPFLLDVLKSSDAATRADCIYTLGLFRDPNAAYYIAPYLSDADPMVRANAMIALWQFPQYRLSLEAKLKVMLMGDDAEEKKAGFFVCGEIRLPYKKLLFACLQSDDLAVSLEAAFALAKQGEKSGFEFLLNHFLPLPEEHFQALPHFLRRLHSKEKQFAELLISQAITQHLNALIRKFSDAELKDFPTSDLEFLKRLYKLLDQHEELFVVEEELRGRGSTASGNCVMA